VKKFSRSFFDSCAWEFVGRFEGGFWELKEVSGKWQFLEGKNI
jgi:hypothetical protein